jgi:hypothetical protein
MDQLLKQSTEPDPGRAADLMIWWDTLTEDEQDLIQVTQDVLPDDRHMLDFLAWSECPLIAATGNVDRPYQITRPDRLHSLLSYM